MSNLDNDRRRCYWDKLILKLIKTDTKKKNSIHTNYTNTQALHKNTNKGRNIETLLHIRTAKLPDIK